MCGLLLLAAVLWLPLGPPVPYSPVPTKQGSDLAVLPGDCALFITVRPADLVSDPLAKAFTDQTRMFDGLERMEEFGQANIERITVANVGGELVTIVRTRKAYEKSKVLETLNLGRFYGFKDRPIKDKEPEKPELREKKVGDKSVHFYAYPGRDEGPTRWIQAVGIVDRNVFVRGNLSGVEELFGSKVKQTEESARACSGLAGKHTIVSRLPGQAAARPPSDTRGAARSEEERKRWDKKGDATEVEKPSKKDDKDDDSVVLPPAWSTGSISPSRSW